MRPGYVDSFPALNGFIRQKIGGYCTLAAWLDFFFNFYVIFGWTTVISKLENYAVIIVYHRVSNAVAVT